METIGIDLHIDACSRRTLRSTAGGFSKARYRALCVLLFKEANGDDYLRHRA